MLINFATLVAIVASFFYARYYACRWFEKAGKAGKEGEPCRTILAILVFVFIFPVFMSLALIPIKLIG